MTTTYYLVSAPQGAPALGGPVGGPEGPSWNDLTASCQSWITGERLYAGRAVYITSSNPFGDMTPDGWCLAPDGYGICRADTYSWEQASWHCPEVRCTSREALQRWERVRAALGHRALLTEEEMGLVMADWQAHRGAPRWLMRYGLLVEEAADRIGGPVRAVTPVVDTCREELSHLTCTGESLWEAHLGPGEGYVVWRRTSPPDMTLDRNVRLMEILTEGY